MKQSKNTKMNLDMPNISPSKRSRQVDSSLFQSTQGKIKNGDLSNDKSNCMTKNTIQQSMERVINENNRKSFSTSRIEFLAVDDNEYRQRNELRTRNKSPFKN